MVRVSIPKATIDSLNEDGNLIIVGRKKDLPEYLNHRKLLDCLPDDAASDFSTFIVRYLLYDICESNINKTDSI